MSNKAKRLEFAIRTRSIAYAHRVARDACHFGFQKRVDRLLQERFVGVKNGIAGVQCNDRGIFIAPVIEFNDGFLLRQFLAI